MIVFRYLHEYRFVHNASIIIMLFSDLFVFWLSFQIFRSNTLQNVCKEMFLEVLDWQLSLPLYIANKATDKRKAWLELETVFCKDAFHKKCQLLVKSAPPFESICRTSVNSCRSKVNLYMSNIHIVFRNLQICEGIQEWAK